MTTLRGRRRRQHRHRHRRAQGRDHADHQPRPQRPRRRRQAARRRDPRRSSTGNPSCIFDAKRELEAFISVFVEIELLFTSLEYEFDLLRLGPYTLFEYGCPDQTPVLVTRDGQPAGADLGQPQRPRGSTAAATSSDDYEVRQFDTGGGAAGGGTTTYEVSAFGRVQTASWSRSPAAGLQGRRSTGPASPPRPTSAAGVHLDHAADLRRRRRRARTTSSRSSRARRSPTTTRELARPPTSSTPRHARPAGSATTPSSPATATTSVTGGDGDDVIDTGAGRRRGRRRGRQRRRSPAAPAATTSPAATGPTGSRVARAATAPSAATATTASSAVPAATSAPCCAPGRTTRDDRWTADQVAARLRHRRRAGRRRRGRQRRRRRRLRRRRRWRRAHPDRATGHRRASSASGEPHSERADRGGDLPPTRRSTSTVDAANVPGDEALDPLCESGTPWPAAANSDFVTGGPRRDVVVGGDGPDTPRRWLRPRRDLRPGGRRPALRRRRGTEAGSNADVIRGGLGSDRADGGAATTCCSVTTPTCCATAPGSSTARWARDAHGAGDDYLDGGDGTDVLSGGDGSDLLLGGAGQRRHLRRGPRHPGHGGTRPPLSDRLLGLQRDHPRGGRQDRPRRRPAGRERWRRHHQRQRPARGLARRRTACLPIGSTPVGPSRASLGTDVVVVGGLVDLDRDGVIGDRRHRLGRRSPRCSARPAPTTTATA